MFPISAPMLQNTSPFFVSLQHVPQLHCAPAQGTDVALRCICILRPSATKGTTSGEHLFQKTRITWGALPTLSLLFFPCEPSFLAYTQLGRNSEEMLHLPTASFALVQREALYSGRVALKALVTGPTLAQVLCSTCTSGHEEGRSFDQQLRSKSSWSTISSYTTSQCSLSVQLQSAQEAAALGARGSWDSGPASSGGFLRNHSSFSSSLLSEWAPAEPNTTNKILSRSS